MVCTSIYKKGLIVHRRCIYINSSYGYHIEEVEIKSIRQGNLPSFVCSSYKLAARFVNHWPHHLYIFITTCLNILIQFLKCSPCISKRKSKLSLEQRYRKKLHKKYSSWILPRTKYNATDGLYHSNIVWWKLPLALTSKFF